MNAETGLSRIAKRESTLVQQDQGVEFRDLNKNGKLDIYEDPRQPVEARVEDLLGRMTAAEKAGMLFINGAVINSDGSLEDKSDGSGFGRSAIAYMADQQMNHFNLWQIPEAQTVAKWHNNLQRHAEGTRLGIPVTIASDPRNHFSANIFSMAAVDFSQWCETLGFGALRNEALVHRFADIVRQEYLAVGIRVALHPQIDLPTEPRWARINGCFSEDAHQTARLAAAYILGFQGERLGPHSVACMTKHFPGGGPQKEGLDPHFDFQKGQIYPGNHFDYHLIPFEAAIRAGTAAIMPYYGVPVDQTDENVAMSYNKAIITGLLREKYGYDGVVCTDWGLITDLETPDFTWVARAWGVEHLSEADRVLKALEAGVDQFGGENCPELVLELVESGRLEEARLDASVHRLLKQKFELGLFDDPFVDEGKVKGILGNPASHAAGRSTQSWAMTLLKNEPGVLPLPGDVKIFVKNLDPGVASGYAQIVEAPEEADFTILRLETPWTPIDSPIPMARDFHHGDLDFEANVQTEILDLMAKAPTVVVLYLDRPAVIPEISASAAGLLVDFGACDDAVLDVVFGRVQPEGRLPFELPSSMAAVRAQRTDVPHDSADPLFEFGFGLSY